MEAGEYIAYLLGETGKSSCERSGNNYLIFNNSQADPDCY